MTKAIRKSKTVGTARRIRVPKTANAAADERRRMVLHLHGRGRSMREMSRLLSVSPATIIADVELLQLQLPTALAGEGQPRPKRHRQSEMVTLDMETIRSLRASGMPVQDIAVLYGKSEATIHKYLHGRHRPG